MPKVLRSFCCLLLFLTLNLCDASSVDYLVFNNFKSFECSKCKKEVRGSLDVINDVKQSNEFIDNALSTLGRVGFSIPNVYMAVVRSDDKNALICSECGYKDMDEQIKSLVGEFCPGFDFSNPRQRDVENLIHNDSFIQKIPREYRYNRYNVKGFEDGKCICCLKDREEDKIDVFKTESCYVCIACGSLFHKVCAERWGQENSCCPNCRNKIGIIPCSYKSVYEGRKLTFRIWVKNGCSYPSPSGLRENYRNMNENDFTKIGENIFKCQDRLKNGEMPDEFLELLLPKKVAPKSKCARFCNWLRSCFKC